MPVTSPVLTQRCTVAYFARPTMPPMFLPGSPELPLLAQPFTVLPLLVQPVMVPPKEVLPKIKPHTAPI